MHWTLQDRGFLPNHDPLTRLNDPVFEQIERLGADLPRLVHERSFRSPSPEMLAAGAIDWEAAVPALGEAGAERIFMLFSYFASAYVHAPGMPAVNRLPACLAVPLVRLAQRAQRPPILSYAS